MPDLRPSRSFLPAVLTLLAVACGGSNEPAPDPVVGPPPLLSASFVDTADVAQFYPFGLYLSIHQKNPAWEVHTRTTTAVVFSATAGTVTEIQLNGQGDYAIRVDAGEGWVVEYDHVMLLQVGVGDALAPGDTLGSVGLWSPTQGRSELQINREGAEVVSVCPASLSTSGVVAAYTALVQYLPSDYLNDPIDGLCYEQEVIP